MNNSNIFIDDTNETCVYGTGLCSRPNYGTYDRTGDKLLQSLLVKVTGSYFLLEGTLLRTGLSFEVRGNEEELFLNGKGKEQEFVLGYIVIPFLLEQRFGSKFGFLYNVGMENLFNVGAESFKGENIKDKVSFYDFGVVANLGFHYKLSEKYTLTSETGFSKGFENIWVDSPLGLIWYNFNVKYSLGLVYKL